ncbi:adenosylcobinamide amidohydrolase [Pseudonocardia spinosispora]|uniref:adenosylcobinamide amidohydrolase n=1 Tax=Pseudonocardia spinosispora TaxID=103441 RepID=UPI001B7F9890|nr:adenosylcobinamide amidohydrolase [Pseudonocardia spinosispora]
MWSTAPFYQSRGTMLRMEWELHTREEPGALLTSALWWAGPGLRMISSAILGGGIGTREWVLNAQVPGGYSRTDPDVHLTELAASHGLLGPGVGLMTAAHVAGIVRRRDEGVEAAATVGLRVPTWAAAPVGAVDRELAPVVRTDHPYRPGTINIVVSVPVALTDAALVNAVATATEAKTQALLEVGYAATGTASDAVCIAAPLDGLPEPFAGPRSEWGARIARAVHSAVHAGATTDARLRSAAVS